VAEHYRSLREDAMRIEAPWLAAVRLTGPDTRSFLQGLATQDLEKDRAGTGSDHLLHDGAGTSHRDRVDPGRGG
jgi:folate-binding Fe-S cluster repair protein YgfZ